MKIIEKMPNWPWAVLCGLALGGLIHLGMRLGPDVEVMTDITRVIMHSPGNYTLVFDHSETKEVTMKSFVCDSRNIKIYTDVSAGKPIWVYRKTGISDDIRARIDTAWAEIHLHSHKEIEVAFNSK